MNNGKLRVLLFFAVFILVDAAILIGDLLLIKNNTAFSSPLPTAASAEPSVCSHPAWENGQCTQCGFVCTHNFDENSTCIICGMTCKHQFQNSVCTICGKVCSHPNHAPDTRECTVCGTLVPHSYKDLTCTICGHHLEHLTGCIARSFWDPCEEAGTVDSVTYTTQNYYSPDGLTYTKHMQVYLPYGYSEENQYDVLILLHGYGGYDTYWFTDGQSYGYPTEGYVFVSPKDMMDHMIQEKICEPMIVVSPTYYLTDDIRQSGDKTAREVTQFRGEIANDILPYLVEHYSTYASGSDRTSLQSARDHFGFMGASFGSILTYNAVMAMNFDLFGWYGMVSGYETDTNYLMNYLNDPSYDGLTIRYLYTSAGSQDVMRTDSQNGYYAMTHYCTRLNSEHACYVDIEDCVHEGRVWTNGLYNCMQVFFTEFSDG